MAVFAYKAADINRKVITGTVVAESPRQARDQLRARMLSVQNIGPARKTGGTLSQSLFRRWRLSRQSHKTAAFFRELSTLLAVGIPLLEALDNLAKQNTGVFRITIEELRDRISSGTSLADAMGQSPEIFDELCLSIVEVGEHSGSLEVALLRLAEFKEKSQQFKGKLANALIYPALVMTIAIGVSLFLMGYVVPQLLAGLIESGRPIPVPTQIVKTVSDIIREYWWLMLLVFAGLVSLAIAAWRRPAMRLHWHRFVLKTPLIGDIVRKQAISRLAVVMSTLLKSGVVFVRAIQIAQRGMPNLVVRTALAKCEISVHAGLDIAKALEQTKIFPPTVVQIFAVGEQSGRLEEMLERLAVDYDHQVATMTHRFTTILEPVLILFMVFIVGLIAFATVLPMLEAGNVL